MPVSTYFANQMADYATSGDLWLALLHTSATNTDTGSTLDEVTAVDYARLYLNPANWTAANLGSCSYASGFNQQATSDWGEVAYYAICTAATAGQITVFNKFPSSATVANGGVVQIVAGTIVYGVTY